MVSAVVVGVDGSRESMAALEWAAREADDRRATLRIVHAGTGSRDVLEEAEAIARAAGATGEITTDMIPGNPGHVLVDESAEAEVELVVVASHGHSRMHDAFAGSCAMYTAMHARCPVIVVRPELPPSEEIRDAVGRVLVGVDGTPVSISVVAFAFEAAERLGIGVTALHTWIQPIASGHDALVPLTTDLEALRHENEAVLSESLAAAMADHPDVDVRQVTLQTVPGAGLIEASKGARLAVIGSHGRGPVAGLLLGSTSQAVLHHAGCPVAVIHVHH